MGGAGGFPLLDDDVITRAVFLRWGDLVIMATCLVGGAGRAPFGVESLRTGRAGGDLCVTGLAIDGAAWLSIELARF